MNSSESSPQVPVTHFILCFCGVEEEQNIIELQQKERKGRGGGGGGGAGEKTAKNQFLVMRHTDYLKDKAQGFPVSETLSM